MWSPGAAGRRLYQGRPPFRRCARIRRVLVSFRRAVVFAYPEFLGGVVWLGAVPSGLNGGTGAA